METPLIDMHKINYDPKKHTRIDRKSIWGNPYELENRKDDNERMQVLWKYALYIVGNPTLLRQVCKLRGKTLACWCYPEYRCHGQILIYLASNPKFVDRCSRRLIEKTEAAKEIFKALEWSRPIAATQTTLF